MLQRVLTLPNVNGCALITQVDMRNKEKLAEIDFFAIYFERPLMSKVDFIELSRGVDERITLLPT